VNAREQLVHVVGPVFDEERTLVRNVEALTYRPACGACGAHSGGAAVGSRSATRRPLLLVSQEGLHRIWSYALTIPVVTIATFLANRAWTFQKPT
jgi:hypothetical protein